jgi:hypothetical protein
MAGQAQLPAGNPQHSWFIPSVRIVTCNTCPENKWPVTKAVFEFFFRMALEAERIVRFYQARNASDIRDIVTEHAQRFFSHQAAHRGRHILFVAIDTRFACQRGVGLLVLRCGGSLGILLGRRNSRAHSQKRNACQQAEE